MTNNDFIIPKGYHKNKKFLSKRKLKKIENIKANGESVDWGEDISRFSAINNKEKNDKKFKLYLTKKKVKYNDIKKFMPVMKKLYGGESSNESAETTKAKPKKKNSFLSGFKRVAKQQFQSPKDKLYKQTGVLGGKDSGSLDIKSANQGFKAGAHGDLASKKNDSKPNSRGLTIGGEQSISKAGPGAFNDNRVNSSNHPRIGGL
ncbi:hypothetical protein C0583_03070 [Candidatus Parcubacteria bacterium]|nr:MAG: hypothetical protein C0583_03070 [Candidatus Parcubacteria bacterium]